MVLGFRNSKKTGLNKRNVCSNMMFECTLLFMEDIWKTCKDKIDSQMSYFYTQIQDYQIKLKTGVGGY